MPVQTIESGCAPSSRSPPRKELKPEDVEAIIAEAEAREITVDGDLVELIEKLKTDPTNVAICKEAVKRAHALPLLAQAKSQEEQDSAEVHKFLKRFANQCFIEAVFGDDDEMTREEIICRLQDLFGEELAEKLGCAMFHAFNPAAATL